MINVGIFWLQEVLWNIHHPECISKIGEKPEPAALGYRVPMFEHEHFGEQPWDLINSLYSIYYIFLYIYI